MNIMDPRNPSVMRHDFSKVPHADIERSMFRRPSSHKTTINAGFLYPVFVDEVLPGDTFDMNMSVVCRMNTPIYPIMDNMILDVHFFFVPNRLVWQDWTHFMGQKDNPDDVTEYSVPQIEFTEEVIELSLADYMGIPPIADLGEETLSVNALPFRAYNLIFKEWYRDQNLQDSPEQNRGAGPDSPADYDILTRCKRHDYFTACLPWPQKGEGVEMPLGEYAPIVARNTLREHDDSEPGMAMWNIADGEPPSVSRSLAIGNTSGTIKNVDAAITLGSQIYGPANLYADLAQAEAVTINSMREAFQLQRLLERDARSGTRYTEILLAHFGVSSPDARLQRPEYLGGGSVPVNIHSVPQTSVTSGTSPTGKLAAYGIASDSGIGFSKAFVEHGYILGIASIRADLTYQQGLNKMWSRLTKYDFYWPALAHLGEQAVLLKELYLTGNPDETHDNKVFGYQERWAEYRYAQSKISGVLRSSHAASLDVWHLSQEFTSAPVLGNTFIKETPPIDRVVAVPSQPHFIMDAFFDLKCARPMPLYSVPGLIDHF